MSSVTATPEAVGPQPSSAGSSKSQVPQADRTVASSGKSVVDASRKEVTDAQAFQTTAAETAARTWLGAQRLFGNLTNVVKEAQSAVADSLTNLAEEGVGPLGAVRRRGADKNAQAASPATSTASKRRDASRSDAAQYFVEYKGLDASLLPPELLPTATASRT
eukprot:TRINITY_DN20506_c0_g1_i1.p1 TRINITY_DN20506_c0_g1~~TRINITY_DN20506_c0_g1_i1.p1  ORF type:complete len:163 (-),score=34.24 TRINITY_DN20506_c0_g1_i1:55-543(-)